jgi:homogentisate 1,2-dioxygenase
MSWNLAAPHSEGLAARQAHADIPADSFEREIGREGFSGAAAHMYHRNPPTAWQSIEGPIRPRAFNPAAAIAATQSPWKAIALLGNPRVTMRYWRIDASMPALARNSDGDELLFIHRGAGDFFCDYGHLAFREGDYILLPRGTMWRLELAAPVDVLMVEATGAQYRLPDRGILGRHTLFDPGVLDRPALDEAFRAQKRNGTWRVEVKRRGQVGVITYPFNPLDAVGWKGDLHPVRLNVQDIRALACERLHLPPSARTTFVSDGFVVCTLTPRPIETDPGAIKLPFFHNNDDYDEVIFYHSGQMSSRGGVIGSGMLTLHPSGVTHGPHPEVLQYMHVHPAKSFENYSVMIDVLDGLEVLPGLPKAVEVEAYGDSWRGAIARAPDAQQAAE